MRTGSPIVAYRMGLATARDVRPPAACRQGARRGVAVALAALAALGPLLAARAQTAPPSVASEHVAFRHVTIAHGLSQNAVTAIVQDRRGFMWFGTKDGLDRYDGYEFIVYRHDPYDSTSIADSEISAVFEDSRGQLWVGTRNGSVNRFDRTRERFERIVGGPSRSVTAIAEDSSGALWVGSDGDGLYRLRAAAGSGDVAVDRFVHAATNPASLGDDRVRAVLVDRSGVLWVGTDAGLDRRDAANAGGVAFSHITSDDAAPFRLIDRRVTALHEDGRGRLWIGSLPGISMLDSARTAIRSYYHRYRTYRYGWGETVRFAEDQSGVLWVATYAELMRFDPASGAFTSVRHDAGDPESISSNLPVVVYRDRSDVIWVGTNGFGLDVHDPKARRFATLRRPVDLPSRISGFSVYAIHEDHTGAVWIDAGVLYRWDRATGALRSFETTSLRPDDFGNTEVWSIVEEPSGVLWAGTNTGLFRYEPATGRTRQYRRDPTDPTGLPEPAVYAVLRGRDGAIWALTETHVVRLADDARGRFESWRFRDGPALGQWGPLPFVQDPTGVFWIGSPQGLARFDARTGSVRRFRNDPRQPASLGNDEVRALRLDPRQPGRVLWVGTAGGGLNRFDLATETFEHITQRDGLPNDVVYGILPDTGGALWLSTNKGLSRYDPSTGRFRNYDAGDGLQSNEFNTGAAFRSRSGELFFGGLYGLNYFRPEDVSDNPHVPAVAITGFRRGGRLESVRDSGTVLRSTISEADTLRLSFRDAVVTFEFAALEYSAPAKNRYAYRMAGLNDDWFASGSVRSATYTNLPPGRYTFQVRASNNDGVWNDAGTSLAVIVLPPWWRTPWAYVLYALLGAGALLVGRRRALQRVRLESRLEIERVEHEQFRQLERARSRLFANVSHEFRTPLTLTLGPLDDLRAGRHGALTPSAVEQVDLAWRNATRVLDLVDEILELARAEAGRVTVRARRLDVGALVRAVGRGFVPLAERKAIGYQVVTPPEPVEVVADPGHLDRALSNLLSNAFKFTPEGGAVRVIVTDDGRSVAIAVRDSGPGIPVEDVGRIFDRFYRALVTAGSHPGTGIGLALAHELIAMHGGSIAVASDEGFGSTFTITLLKGTAHLPPDRIADDGTVASWTPRGVRLPPHTPTAPLPAVASGEALDAADAGDAGDAGDVPQVLVVDDNAEIRAFVRQHLEPSYRVLEARSGEEGLELTRRRLPDLVLSDVMMPGMDGFALCRALKADPETDFVPVILLTARVEAEDRIAGLAERADDYLTQPFDVRELRLRIGNAIATRRGLRARFASHGSGVGEAGEGSAGRARVTIHPEPVAIEPADARFIAQVQAAVEAGLGDDTYSVERLAAEVAQSRGNLHRRLRDLAGEAPSALIRRMRLERAAELLAAGAGSVSEVGYAVGFKSVAHFSNAFHDQYGVRPSAWKGQRPAG